MADRELTKRLTEDRGEIVRYLNSQLVGPAGGDEEILLPKDAPHTYYLMGALFPQGAGIRGVEEEEEDQTSDDPISMAYQLKPASVGLSFYLHTKDASPRIRVSLSAASYVKGEEGWRRHSLATPLEPEVLELEPGSRSSIDGVLSGRASLTSTWRQMEDGYLVTVALVNSRKVIDGRLNPEDVIHQVWLKCVSEESQIGAYPSPNRYSWDEEEEELALIYQNKRTFAIGHGCSALWSLESGLTTEAVETSFLPRHEVPPVTANLRKENPLINSSVFSLQYLSDPKIEWDQKQQKLKEFIDDYGSWIKGQAAKEVPTGLADAAGRILKRLALVLGRMNKGLEFLSKDPAAQECFLIANRAMLMQMIHSRSEFGGTLRAANNFDVVLPDYSDEDWRSIQWRPFQLAFQLLALESIGNTNSSDREVADLIWFPTGGGKTEAYLAVAAFELFHRRHQYGDAGGGTSVILRYTLRLLTTQQFQRAAALICACETIRKENEDRWGEEPFSLGLWVGQATTPNRLDSESEQSPGAFRNTGVCGNKPNRITSFSYCNVHGVVLE